MESPKIFWAFFILVAGGFFYLGRATKHPRVETKVVQEETCAPVPEAVTCPAVATTSVAPVAPAAPPAARTVAQNAVTTPEQPPIGKEYEGEWEYQDRSDSLRLRITAAADGLSGGYMMRLPNVTNPSSGDFLPEDASASGRDKIIILDEMVRIRLSDAGASSLSGTIEVMDEARGTWDSYKNIVLNKIERRRF